MLFDLKRFWQAGLVPHTAQWQCDGTGFEWLGFSLQQPMQLDFSASTQNDGVQIEIRLQAAVCADCARCLSPVVQSYSLVRSWVLKEAEFLCENTEFPIDANGKLDLDALACQELSMEVPSVLLCSHDCQGLCQGCGNPIAHGCSCQAQQHTPDPRLAILKQLLQ